MRQITPELTRDRAAMALLFREMGVARSLQITRALREKKTPPKGKRERR